MKSTVASASASTGVSATEWANVIKNAAVKQYFSLNFFKLYIRVFHET